MDEIRLRELLKKIRAYDYSNDGKGGFVLDEDEALAALSALPPAESEEHAPQWAAYAWREVLRRSATGACLSCGCAMPFSHYQGCPAAEATPLPSQSEKSVSLALLNHVALYADIGLQTEEQRIAAFRAIAKRFGYSLLTDFPSQSEDSAPARVVPMRLFAGIDAKPSAIRQVLAVVGMKLEPNALDELQDKASAPEGKRESCHWHEDCYGNWVADCGLEWSLIDGIPSENDMKYCPKCGNELIEHGYFEDSDEPERSTTP